MRVLYIICHFKYSVVTKMINIASFCDLRRGKKLLDKKHKVCRNCNIKSEMRSFKRNENIHKKEGGSYYVVSANKASSVTL